MPCLFIPENSSRRFYIVPPDLDDLTGAQGKMEFKEKRSTSASPLFTLTNDNGLTMGFPDTTITLNGIDYDGSKVVLVTISYDQALLIGGRRTWCDLLINFGDGRVKNVFPSGIQVIGCKAVTTLPDEPDPDDPIPRVCENELLVRLSSYSLEESTFSNSWGEPTVVFSYDTETTFQLTNHDFVTAEAFFTAEDQPLTIYLSYDDENIVCTAMFVLCD